MGEMRNGSYGTGGERWMGMFGGRRIVAGFAAFLALMWVCTLVSKVVYTSKLPQVQAGEAEKKKIEHIVESDGIVKQGSERAIHTLPGLRVEKISVRTGDTVEKGDVLFTLDMGDLEEIIAAKELEAAKLEYQIADLLKNRQLAAEEKQRRQERAGEDYDTAVDAAGRGLGRAEAAWQEADGKLQNHLADGVDMTPAEGRESARREYEDWLKRGSELEATVSGNIADVAERERRLEEMQGSASPEEIARANGELEAAKEKLRASQTAYEEYGKHPMKEPDFTSEDAAKKAWETEKNSLEENLRDAGDGREDAQLSGEAGIRDAGRNREDAQAQSQADSTLEIYRLQLQALEKEIEKYRGIYGDGGQVVSEVDGTVTGIHLTAGERTTDGAAIVCADKEIPYQFETLLGKEQKKYVNQGDTVTLKTAQGMEELEVDYMEEDGSGSYRAVVYLPQGRGEIGMSGTMHRSASSEFYNCCIPASALHSEGYGRYFVYVVGERDGILGKEYYAQLRYVEVLDQNDRYAALAEGSLTGEERVVTGYDKEIGNGMAVRYVE